MSLHRESGLVESDRIVWQEWVCESKVNDSCVGSDLVADAVSSRYRGTI